MQTSIQISELTQGSIAWAAYPLTDKLDKLKRRPVLVISNAESNGIDTDYIVLPITKTIREEPFSMVIEPADVQGALPIASEIRCNKPFTVRNVLIFERIGQLSADKVRTAIALLQRAVQVNEPAG